MLLYVIDWLHHRLHETIPPLNMAPQSVIRPTALKIAPIPRQADMVTDQAKVRDRSMVDVPLHYRSLASNRNPDLPAFRLHKPGVFGFPILVRPFLGLKIEVTHNA